MSAMRWMVIVLIAGKTSSFSQIGTIAELFASSAAVRGPCFSSPLSITAGVCASTIRAGPCYCRSTTSRCFLLNTNMDDQVKEGNLMKDDRNLHEAVLIYSFPATTALSAFVFYPNISKAFHSLVLVLSSNNWLPVDGGNLIAEIILPAINGPVLSSIGLLFATLVATTIGQLYQRQTQMSSTLYRNFEDIRRLALLLGSFPKPYRSQAQKILAEQCDDTFQAASAGTITEDVFQRNNLNQVFLLINKLSRDLENDDSLLVPGAILGEAYELLRRIHDNRTTFRSLLYSSFPPLHYINLAVLGTAICIIFLIETDRDLMFFLAGFQLRLLWSMLIGTFAMMAAVIWDLTHPFSGSYNIVRTTDVQLNSFRAYVSAPWEDD